MILKRTDSWYSTARIGEDCSAFKVLVEKGSGRILGAHLLGSNTEELINLFTMAMRAELKAGEVQELIFGYPTFASDMGYMV